MGNYIVINGKKAELTEEQLKELGIKVQKKRNNPFTRGVGKNYYTILENGIVYVELDGKTGYDNDVYKNANYFADRSFANQIHLHELLNRKLLKYAWDNEAEDCEWSCDNIHWYIQGKHESNDIDIEFTRSGKIAGVIYFSKRGVARHAIEDVIMPFVAEHPEFVW